MATSHHGGAASDRPDSELIKRFLEQIEGKARREYPGGRAGGADEGTLAFAVVADRAHGIVRIEFGKSVEWIGLAPADVARLVELLVQKAREVATEPFSVNL